MNRARASFVAGVALGLVLAGGLSHAAGYLFGWTVEVEVRGLRIRCDDPWVWDATKPNQGTLYFRSDERSPPFRESLAALRRLPGPGDRLAGRRQGILLSPRPADVS